MIERLVDIAADELEIDPAELRRRNTIPPERMPYKTPLGCSPMTAGISTRISTAPRGLPNWRGFETRRKLAAQRGMLRGIGISNTIEQAADPTYETAEIRFDPLGGTDTSSRLDLARPGPHHDPDADAGRPARCRSRADQVHRRRHRRGGVRHGHRRLALDHDERRRHRRGQRQDHRQRQEARRAYLGGRGSRHRIQGWPLHHRRHRPRHGASTK